MTKYAASLIGLGNIVLYSLPRVHHLYLPVWVKLRVLLLSAHLCPCLKSLFVIIFKASFYVQSILRSNY